MRVLHLHRSILLGGEAHSVLQLIGMQRKMGMQPVLLTNRQGPLWDLANKQGVEVFRHSLDTPGWQCVRSSIRHWSRLLRIVYRANVDILHICGIHLLNECHLLATLSGLPTIIHARGPVRAHQLNPRVRWALRHSDVVICISHFVRKTLQSSMPAVRARVIYNGVDPASYLPRRPRSQMRSELGLSDDAFLVGFVGHFVQRWKKHETLVRAAARLRDHENVAFVIVGGQGPDPSYFREVRSLIAQLGLSDHVRLVGAQSDVASYYRAMDAFVSCSEGEGFGRVLAEAMMCGIPVIATKSGACPEVVQEGHTGFLYAVDDEEALARCIVRLARNPKLAEQMGQRGRTRALRLFSINTHAASVAEVYQEVLRQPSFRPAAYIRRALSRLGRLPTAK